MTVGIDRIRPNRKQPRRDFEPEALRELAGSIRDHGLLQPIVVRPLSEGHYEIVAGERRWRAAQQAGVHDVPVLVRDADDPEMLELALVENLQREELNPLEEALAYQALIDDHGLTQQEVAERVGKNRATVANSLRVLALPQVVRDHVRSGALSLGHAKALASVTSPGALRDLAERVVREGLSVRQTEAAVARLEKPARASKDAPSADPNVADAEKRLERAFSTQVRIVQGRRGGRIELRFFSDEEMERVYQLLMRATGSSV